MTQPMKVEIPAALKLHPTTSRRISELMGIAMAAPAKDAEQATRAKEELFAGLVVCGKAIQGFFERPYADKSFLECLDEAYEEVQKVMAGDPGMSRRGDMQPEISDLVECRIQTADGKWKDLLGELGTQDQICLSLAPQGSEFAKQRAELARELDVEL